MKKPLAAIAVACLLGVLIAGHSRAAQSVSRRVAHALRQLRT